MVTPTHFAIIMFIKIIFIFGAAFARAQRADNPNANAMHSSTQPEGRPTSNSFGDQWKWDPIEKVIHSRGEKIVCDPEMCFNITYAQLMMQYRAHQQAQHNGTGQNQTADVAMTPKPPTVQVSDQIAEMNEPAIAFHAKLSDPWGVVTAYHDCLNATTTTSKPRGIKCQCTKKLFDCLRAETVSNCTHRTAETYCSRYLVQQSAEAERHQSSWTAPWRKETCATTLCRHTEAAEMYYLLRQLGYTF